MSEYHVMEADPTGKQVRVIVHIAVPNEANFAGKTLSACIMEDPEIPKASVIPWDIGAEAAAIAAGTLLEREVNFITNVGSTNAQKRDQMDALYQKAEVEEIKHLRARYWAWGFGRNVP